LAFVPVLEKKTGGGKKRVQMALQWIVGKEDRSKFTSKLLQYATPIDSTNRYAWYGHKKTIIAGNDRFFFRGVGPDNESGDTRIFSFGKAGFKWFYMMHL
jgi:hypothetical protein